MSLNTQGSGGAPLAKGLGLNFSAAPQGGSPQGAALSSLANTSTPQRAVSTPSSNPTDAAYGGTTTSYQSSSTPSIGTNPGLLHPQAPSQPIKTHEYTTTDASGNVTNTKQTYDTGSSSSSNSSTSPSTTSSASNIPGQTGSSGSSAPVLSPYGQATQNIGNVANTGANDIRNTGLYGANQITNAAFNSQYAPAIQGSIGGLYGTANNAQNIANNASNQINTIGQITAGTAGGYTNGGLLSQQALGGATDQQNVGAARTQAVTNAENAALAGNSQAQTAYNNSGQLGLTGQGQQITGATNAASNALTGATGGATNALTGATTVASNTAPQQYGLYNQPYNPTTDSYGGGGSGGGINRSVQANNIGLAGQYNTTINNTTQAQGLADDSFSIASSIASQGGIPDGVPALNAIKQKFSNIAGGDSTISSFQNSIQQLLTQYQSITGSTPPYDVNNITTGQLQSLKSSLDSYASNKINTTRRQLNGLSSGGSSSDSSSSDPLGIL